MSNAQQRESRNNLFPIFLKPERLQLLIVGGGNAGSEKLRFLLKSSPTARVTLVAPEVSEEITTLAASHPNVTLLLRAFSPDDLKGKDVVIIATENPALNRAIREQAKELKVLANVADTPHLCDFYLGSIVTRGDLKIAISTNGRSPTFARRFRELLEESLPDELPQLLKSLHTLRDRLKVDFSQKVKILNALTLNLISKE
ncbi:MAG: hypothetical protein KatS3mg031_0692 [Chitinophagales bacterium]|nr:MAG: hypothetical protein KatS3mg031_0692 [Chitinophagales bacterium]